MDSPLLPTLSKPNYSLEEDPSLLADLSLDSEPPLSPTSHNLSSSHSFTGGRQELSGSVSSSRSHSVAQGNGRVRIDAQLDDEINEEEGRGDYHDDKKTKAKAKPETGNKPRFSLFAAPRPPSADDDGAGPESDRDDNQEEEEEADQTIHVTGSTSQRQDEGSQGKSLRSQSQSQPDSQTQQPKQSSAEREGKLRESLYELRKMNEVFESFLGALEGVRGHNQRLAQRVQQTSALLDEYTAIMGQAEHTQRLLTNPKWTGSADDAAALMAEEQARQVAEQAAMQEAQRAAEAARLAQDEKERRERERASEVGTGRLGRGRGRGGIGASVSGTRGGVTRGRGTGIPRPSVAAPRPTSASATRKGTTTGATSGGGLGGQYSHVKSSGYGPK
ncbi:hypothetical protein IAR55_005782 [Kwoniella newhampshirensis]|uniref:DASH complex subunit DUO1 n=1 Tax=Kwoniella newhampshirensis TaxID=1651941 RepID=A0AAW0YG81_9TREE